MVKCKKYDNGLRLIVNSMAELFSVSVGVIVNTGSRNETKEEHGLSHFIEHTVFKGTKTRSAFEISKYIDEIGAQINAFTSKELTCFYTKSIKEHTKDCISILSDIFFNSEFDATELAREKNVIIEEINMDEDSPEDILLDLLAESYFGNVGLGQTILGTKENVKSFTKEDVLKYMDKYYTADNVVISVSGNISFEDAENMVKEFFADKFTRINSVTGNKFAGGRKGNLAKVKKIEQLHLGFSLPVFSMFDDRVEALSIANMIFGGCMSSRLFQKVREELSLCYAVYSYISNYKDCGVLEIYSGVQTDKYLDAVDAILSEIKKFKKGGLTEQEFYRGKEQIKSAFVLGRESTYSQMLLFGKYYLHFDKAFDFEAKLKKIDGITKKEVDELIYEVFDETKLSVAMLGAKKPKLKV